MADQPHRGGLGLVKEQKHAPKEALDATPLPEFVCGPGGRQTGAVLLSLGMEGGSPRPPAGWHGTGMNVDLPQHSLTRIDELVGNTSPPDHHLPAIHLDRVITHGKSSMALQDHKEHYIRMLVQSGAFTRRRLHPEKRNRDPSMFSSLKHMGRRAALWK